MNTLHSAAFLALLALTACFATSKGDADAKKAPEPARTTTRLGKVEFHTNQSIVSIPVSDLAASKAWYARVLGSSVVYELPEQGWCEISTPVTGTLIGLHQQQGASAGPANALGVGVVDMAAARAHLMALNVRFENDVIEIPGVVKLLYFLDPDGNRMWFYAPAS